MVAVALGSGVATSWVDVGVRGVCVLDGGMLGSVGIGVIVTGGVTRKSSCCPGWITESEGSPFQAINSASLIS